MNTFSLGNIRRGRVITIASKSSKISIWFRSKVSVRKVGPDPMLEKDDCRDKFQYEEWQKVEQICLDCAYHFKSPSTPYADVFNHCK